MAVVLADVGCWLLLLINLEDNGGMALGLLAADCREMHNVQATKIGQNFYSQYLFLFVCR